MKEEKIEKEVTLCDPEILDAKKPSSKLGKQRKSVSTDLIARARSLYITTDMSIVAIAEQLGLNKFTLQKYCQVEKWSLLKQKPEFSDWSLEVVNEIYDKISFYNDAQSILHNIMLDEQYQTPKDLKSIVEAYRTSDERMTALRLLKENANKENDTEY